ncbi:MAG: hypothetical protein ABJB12_03300 [Pseudomonadota bacterium]
MRASFAKILGASAVLVMGSACGGAASNKDGAGGAGQTGGSGAAGYASGGSSPGAGAAGIGGGSPVNIGPQAHASKLDVLFVLDNSLSMSDKHALLSASIPGFVTGLSKAVSDIHFGVITTSIGGHGGTVCADQVTFPHQDDQAELLPAKRTGVPTYAGTDFLSYDAAGKTGSADPAAVASDLQKTIAAVGEDGCGYEAPLEAMYRFLIDPEPPASVQKQDTQSVATGTNDVLLNERKAFLRPDSAVAIVILSDENDCSIQDNGNGWFVGGSMKMPRATSACDANPNDPCCRSCAESEVAPPAGCSALAQDSVCGAMLAGQPYVTWDGQHDSLNLRCFDQQRRFGFDLLYPVERYQNGLSNPRVPNRAGALVDNPLLAGGRSATLISVSTIVGAPWQDLAASESLAADHALAYLDGAALAANHRWPVLLGEPAQNQPPSDPFMIESIAPRTGENPLSHDKIAPPTAQDPGLSAINGHERNLPDNDDLQYACTFALPNPRPCTDGAAACLCAATRTGDLTSITTENSPLCQPPAGGAPSTTQYYNKATPGARELRLAELLAERAVPASICPKVSSGATSPDYAYAAALNALTTRIASTLK